MALSYHNETNYCIHRYETFENPRAKGKERKSIEYPGVTVKQSSMFQHQKDISGYAG
jgi:hypothetical protein